MEFSAIQYVANQQGHTTGVLIPIEVWREIQAKLAANDQLLQTTVWDVRSCRQIDEWGNHQDSQEGMGNALEIVCPLKHDYILSQIILVDTPEGA